MILEEFAIIYQRVRRTQSQPYFSWNKYAWYSGTSSSSSTMLFQCHMKTNKIASDLLLVRILR